ncbi:MAG TPA: hypothetical protein VFK74_10145, partial [Azospira sp.]|nr:hypothetical protein [Azospira sp.]
MMAKKAVMMAATLALTVLPVGILRALLVADYAPYFIAGAMSYLVWSDGPSPARVGTILAAWLVSLHRAAQTLPEFEQHYHTTL